MLTKQIMSWLTAQPINTVAALGTMPASEREYLDKRVEWLQYLPDKDDWQ